MELVGFPDVESGDDVGVIEFRRGLAFLIKALDELGTRVELGDMILMATMRSRLIWRALNTSAMPPAPMGPRISNPDLGRLG